MRSGEKSALVTAVFSGRLPVDWCEENGIELSEDELFLSRKISSDGKNSCRVNGVPVPVASLRELGSRLMDIHGQNDGLSLLDERRHIDYLDSFGEYDTELRDYFQAFSSWKNLYKEAEGLRIDESEKERISESLRYCIDELERANIQPGELEEKQARSDLLKNAVKLISALESAYEAIYGGSGSPGVLGCLGDAEGHIRSALRKYAELEDISDRLSELRYNAEDLAEEIRDRAEALDASPQVLEELASRVDLIKRLCRKYKTDESGLAELLEESKKRLDDVEYADDKLKKIEKELELRHAELLNFGQRLSEKRLEAGKRLEKRIVSELKQLSMSGVTFKVDIRECPENPRGMDSVAFLMSANPGEKPGKINRIASGGELSRIMLALKSVLTEKDDADAMVFDEVDTGVSGIAAQRVAEKMCAISAHRQVICVTHLPQIASMADTHFCIEKSVSGDRTQTHVKRLDTEGRKRELARLTGGENITPAALTAAQEQLSSAEKYKTKLQR